jgi:hypothetical protein
LEQECEQTWKEAVEGFEEVRCRAMVAEHLVQEDNGRIYLALLLLGLEVHGKWFQKENKAVNII